MICRYEDGKTHSFTRGFSSSIGSDYTFIMGHSQRGNILFMILLAVVLFAALAYAITSSMRGGGNNASSEAASAKAAAVMQYFSNMENTISRMMLVGDVKDYQINFYYNRSRYAVFSSYDNPNCTESRCRVFDPAGGGLMPLDPAVYKKKNSPVDHEPYIVYKPLANLGTAQNELLIELQGVDWNLCQAINANVGITSMPYGIPNTNAAQGSSQPYVHSGAFTVGDNVPAGTQWAGPSTVTEKRMFCYCRPSTKSACEADPYSPNLSYVLMVK
jgi:hypothetical protein